MSIFGRTSARHDYANAEIQRIIDDVQTTRNEMGISQSVNVRALKTITRGSERNIITLSPMKSLSVEDFTYPFASTSKIRDALRLKVMPFSAAGNIDIFPVILSKSGRNSSGIVWYVSHDELDIPSVSHKVWPAPLPFVSKLAEFGGNGVTFWIDENNICSLLWQSNRPVLYRWRNNEGNIAQIREASWYDNYCERLGLNRGGDYVVHATGGDNASYDMRDIVSESISICPWIADVNLSPKVLEGERDLARTIRISAKIALFLFVTGGIFLSSQFVDWYRMLGETQNMRERSEALYRSVFDPQRTGRISNPVTLARDKIASVSGKAEEGHQIDEVLADTGDIFTSMKDSGMTIDTLRYNAEGFDCTGTAPDMTTVLNFRRSWEDRANLVQVDNTQFVSGIGYRFDIRIRW